MTTEELNKLLKPLLPKDKRAFVGIGKKCIFHDYGASIGMPVTITGVHFDENKILLKCKGICSTEPNVPIENLFQNYMEVYKQFHAEIDDIAEYIWIDQLNGAILRHNQFEIDILRKCITLANKLKRLHEKKMSKKENKH